MLNLINEQTISSAHYALVKRIMTYGKPVLTEDREVTIELPYPLVVHIDEPLKPYRILRKVGFGQHFMTDYAKQLRSITSTGFTYTYGNRLCDYPLVSRDVYCGNGDGHGINQVQVAIDKLNMSPNTRRAIMHTWCVPLDTRAEHVPCMQTVQFLKRDNKLNCIATFRSNDMLMAWGGNAYGLSELLRHVAEGTSSDVGYLETYSMSAHIYNIRDKTTLDNVMDGYEGI